MQRRSFAATLISAAVAAALPAAAGSRAWSRRADPLPTFARVALDLPGGGRFVPDALVWAGRPALAVHLLGDVPLYDEDRLDLGDLGPAARVLRPVLARRLAGAVPAGEVAAVGRLLVVRPLPGVAPPARVLVVQGRQGFEPAGELAPRPPLAHVAGPALGRAFATAEADPTLRRLVLLVPPVALPLPPGIAAG